ncbi:MAG: ATP-binding protein [Spirochaetaceae bacterium]|jgi:predicted ATPase|nr:ATP-binding protein [Spirochaetaceae bacterium]
MERITIKNFGPIKNGFVDINKVTLFCGPQGSGKSTVAKLISTFAWLEKSLVRGENTIKDFEKTGVFKNQFLSYHRLENYTGIENAEIEYKGSAYSFIFSKKGSLSIKEIQTEYELPQIMYIPAERNFVSYFRKPNEIKSLDRSLTDFLTEFDNSKELLKTPYELPFNDIKLEYDRLNDNINVTNGQYKLRLSHAASGFQSVIPVFLVSQYLSKIVQEQHSEKPQMSVDERKRFLKEWESIREQKSLTDEQKQLMIQSLSSKFRKTAFINIVEEPEQNLFPVSQITLVNELLKIVNLGNGHNKLIMTTHSPYILSALTIAVQGKYLSIKIEGNKNSEKLLSRLSGVVPLDSCVGIEDVSIYQIDYETGSIQALPKTSGVPSDDNYLNSLLDKGNVQFDWLLEIEEDL